MLMFNIFLVTLVRGRVGLLSLSANTHCYSGWDRDRLDYNNWQSESVWVLPGGSGRQRPLVASRIRNMKWNTDHSAGLPRCVLERTHTYKHRKCYITWAHMWRGVTDNLHMWTNTHTQRGGDRSTHVWRWTHTFCQRFTLVKNMTLKKTHTHTHCGGRATHKHKTRGPSLYFSQTDSSMCLMSSSYTHTQTHTCRCLGKDSNETFSLTCSLSQRPERFCATQATSLKTCNVDIFLQWPRGNVHPFYDQFPYFPLFFSYFPFSFPLNKSGAVGTHMFQHKHVSDSIIRDHSTALDWRVPAACWNTHSLLSFFLSMNDHSLISCRITGRQSASFTSCSSGKASTTNVLQWPQGGSFN